MAKKILCYNPYTAWSIHSVPEMTLLHALWARGHQVHYVGCNAVFSECDLYARVHNQGRRRPEDFCAQCQDTAMAMLARMGMPHGWLGAWLHPDEQCAARIWADDLRPDQLKSATYGDWPIGRWVISSVFTNFRFIHLDYSDPEVVHCVREFAYSGLIAAFALSRMLDTERPDILLTFNGRMFSTRIAMELAKARGIRFFAEERGDTLGWIRLFKDENCHATGDTDRLWRDWKDTPLNQDEVELLGSLLDKRLEGRFKEGVPVISRSVQDSIPLLESLGVTRDRPIWLALTSSEDEAIASEIDMSGPCFANQREWMAGLTEYGRANPNVQILIRVHPSIGSKVSIGHNRDEIELYETLAREVPSNIKVIPSYADVSTYSLMMAADVGLNWVSTAGIEMASFGKPVVSFSGYWNQDNSFFTQISNPSEFGPTMERLQRPITPEQAMDYARAAWRYGYIWFYRRSLLFPLVHHDTWYTATPTYSSQAELLPGCSRELDHIIDSMLGDSPLYPPPIAEERARPADAETRRIQAFRAKFGL